MICPGNTHVQLLERENKAAEAEIQRLRSALRDIATRGTGIGASVCTSVETLQAIAKLALEGR